MIKFFKSLIKKELNKRNLILIKKTAICLEIPITPKNKVIAFIEKLRPYNVGIDLIRLGPDYDGGYLVPNDLDGIKACFSPGVDQVSDFEKDCYHRGMQLFLADQSVVKPNLDLDNDKFSFLKKFIGCSSNEDFITMDDWVNESKIENNADLLLQMDIEGAEFYTLINTSDSLMKQFRIIVIEFHNLQRLWNHEFYDMAEVIFNKIFQTHTCVHIHPNNCCGIDTKLGVEIPRVAEFTFLRNDRIKEKSRQMQFPHKLDFDNTPNATINLPEIWYK